MASPRQLSFFDDTSPSSPSLSRRNPLRKKHSLKRPASESVAEQATKTKKPASPLFTRIWNEEDELTVLKGLVDYKAKTKLQPNHDWNAFYCFLGGSIAAKYSKEQVVSKIRKLKGKFLANMKRIDGGKDTVDTNSELFAFSRMVWGRNEPELVIRSESDNQEETVQEDEQMANPVIRSDSDNQEDMVEEDEQMANPEPLEENVANHVNRSESDNQEEMVQEDEQMANPVNHSESDNQEETVKEAEHMANPEPLNENVAANTDFDGNDADVDADADESCAVRDAFEAMVLRGLSDYQKRLQLEKLVSLGSGKRKELSNEWKALCAEEVKLNVKKLRFYAKLAEAATDR